MCGILSISNAQNHSNLTSKKVYSYTPDGKAEYERSKQKILVKFIPDLSFEQKAEIIHRYSMLKPLQPSMLLPSPKVAILEFSTGEINDELIDELLAQLNAELQVEYANPFLIFKDGTLQGITDRFYVKLKCQADYSILEFEAKKNKFTIQAAYEYDPLLFFIQVDKLSSGNALQLANKMAETRKFAAAEPDFLLLLKKMIPNDTYLNYQWSLNNTGSSIQYSGTPGADMNVFNAWNMTTGNASTKIAVIDEGVDLAHPDLVANMLGGYDGTGLGSGGAPSGDDAHGTNCAGIIAAVGNNSLGVAGVAYSSKIVPVRIAYGSGSSWVTSNAWIGTSIDWAWNQGDADVLSNSWGGGSSSSLINDAIGRATTLGRGGLGSPVLFAAGNDNGPVSYPATLTNVISVTAMSMCNQRKSTTSCDGETFWGSNYGTGTDVSAPGVKIYSTDISGASGYSTGDYYATFNGTSSATPNTSGVMALILSVNPALTMTQARQILESTCDKVGGYTYSSGVSGQPNGTWSNDLGYGKINAYAAVQLANPSPCVNPPVIATTNASPSSICVTGSVALTLTGILFGTGQTYQWQSSPNNVTYTSISGATNSSYSPTVSATTWFRCVVTCGASTNSTPVQVIFNNPTITSFPHTQNFDGSSSLPCGWSVVDVNADGFTWSPQTLNARSTPNTMTYSYNISNAANDWLFSAPLSLTAGTNYQVRFWYRVRSASFPEKLEVKWGSAASAAGMTSAAIFSNTNLTNTSYLEAITSTITPTTSGIYYVGFRVFSNADEYDLNIDDVTFETTCTTPSVSIAITSGSNPSCTGSSVTFTATGTNVGVNPVYQWKLNGSNVGTNSSTYSSSAITTGQIVTCVVTSNAPCNTTPTATSNAITMTINPVLTPAVSIALTGGTNPTCAGNSVTFTATPTNGGSTPVYQWKLNGVNTGTNSSTFSSTTITNGQVVTCVLTSSANCAIPLTATSNSITMSINTAIVPSVSIALTSGTNPSCTGSSKTFTATPTNGGTPSYQWKVNGVNAGTNSPTFTSGTLTNGQIVTCVMTSTANCASPTTATSNAITLTVNSTLVPAVAIAIGSGSNPSCNGANVTFTASPTNGGTPSYQWKVNGVNVGTNSSTYSSTTLSNTQVLTCVMTSTASCASPTTATSNAITMTITPSVTPAILIALTGGTNPSCAGTLKTFTATPTNGGSTPSYQWKVNGANVGTNSSTYSSSALTNAQIVTCVLTSNANCVSSATATSNAITMTINSLPSVSASNVSACAGNAVNLIGSPAGGSFSVSNPYTGPSTTYTYSFTNTNGCSATSTAASITMNNASVNTPQTVSACNSYTWSVNGLTYTTSGTRTASFLNSAGCDSSKTLFLTIKNSSSSNINITTFPSYTWTANGVTYTATGVYSHTLVNSVGCDSVLTLNLTISSPTGVAVSPKVFLSGPYQATSGLMHDSLRTNNQIPLIEPYSAPPFNYPQIMYSGGETITPSILSVAGNNAIVDWIFIELRSSANSSTILATKRALLQRDGDIVSASDGTSPVMFSGFFAGNYYVSIKHRNHLGVMTASAIALNSTATVINFTNNNPVWTNPLILNAPRKIEGGVYLLYSGDANSNKTIKYNGASNDKDAVLSAIGIATPNNTITGYRKEDLNLDARIKYNNADNDRGVILNSVGANTPNIMLFQHTPN